jgi:tRNA/tmRNA/rRNA uracil-C5-methylase (TrmA/RlmC/RlmD family)
MLSDYTAVLRELPIEGSFAGILHTHNDRTADAVCNEGTDILYGEDHFTEELLGLSFKVTVFSFFQTNSAGAEVLYGRVRDAIYDIVDACGLDSPLIYDLYSGTGTIAQVLAPVAGEVCGVEIVEEAVEAASENAALNGLSNCSFICGDVLRVLDDLSRKPDIIILDPPRDGVHPGALPKIIAYGVSHIIYIACKATSLARDLPVFFEGGYEVSTMRAVDMFPRTPNTEVICVLSRRGTQDQVCEIYLNLRKSL